MVGLTVEAVNASATGLFTPRSVATLSVTQQGNVFTVKGIENSNYAIYSVAGSELANGQITNNKMQLNLNKGIYLLKANGQVAKFAVK